jgi:hypothetical protein
MHIVDLSLIAAIEVKDLNTMVFAIRDIHPTIWIAANIMGQIKLAWSRARLTPRH